MVGSDNSSNERLYNIDEDDVQDHAPIVFDCLRQFYSRMDALSKVLVEPKPIAERLKEIITTQGVLPGERVAYESGLLMNDQFRMTVVYHLCLSTWLGFVPSWEEYTTLLDMLENAVLEDERNRPEPISPQSTILKLFDVSPVVLPKTFLQKAQVVDEFSMATSFIYEEVGKARVANEGFESFKEYYNYMYEHVQGITKKLNEQGMYSTHEPERFALIAMSLRHGLPRFDIPYVMPGRQASMTPTKAMRHMLARIMFHTMGLDPGEYTEDGMMGEGGENGES